MDNFEHVKKVIRFFQENAMEIAIYLVVNMKTRDFMSNNIFDQQTEFFSEEELGDLIKALEELNIYHEISYGEMEFAQKVVSGKIQFQKFKYKIIYNTTGASGGRSKSSIVPAICELYGLNYASSDIFSSSILENKIQSFSLLKSYRLPTPYFWIYDNFEGWINGKPNKELKIISKPAYGCASLGITKKNVSFFTNEYELMVGDLSRRLIQPIMVQEFVPGWEVEMPVFDLGYPVTFAPVGVKIANNEFLDDNILTYELVSEDKYAFYNFGARYHHFIDELRDIACRSFHLLSLRGTVRVDFRISKNGQCYITDYNNSPHLTRFHSCAQSAEYMGISYEEMLCLCLYKAVSEVEY
jgi:D-alanine-D-alanine ligase